MNIAIRVDASSQIDTGQFIQEAKLAPLIALTEATGNPDVLRLQTPASFAKEIMNTAPNI
jgi:hypothetical protein